MMELFIETLTGAAFELRVSPFETIMSVKAKIQRLEGIPISQQHLIWQTVELDDDFCLHDYDIHNGATLKLVLAMRGGPINTRRVPIEDSSYMEYMEQTPDDMEKTTGRQVTLLVFREGDQLNFFRVVDRGDGTMTPLSESLSATSMYNMYEDEEDCDSPTKEKNEENAKIKEKIDILRSKMDNMNITKKTKKLVPTAPPGRPTSSARLQSIRSATHKPQSASTLNPNPRLPPVQQRLDNPSSYTNNEHTYAKSQSTAYTTLSKPLSQPKLLNQHQLTELIIPKPPANDQQLQQLAPRSSSYYDNSMPNAQATSQRRQQSLSSSSSASSSNVVELPSASTRSAGLTAGSSSILSGRVASESRIKAIPEDEPSSADSNYLLKALPAPRRKENTSVKLKESVRGPSAMSGEAGTHLSYRSSSRQHDSRVSSRQLALESFKDSICSQRITLESLTTDEAKMMSGLLQQASFERLGSSSISNFSPVRQKKGHPNQLKLDEEFADEKAQLSHYSLSHSDSSSAKLPPVVQSTKKKGKSNRCFICTKKTGLANSYICRCGNNFCAKHRYAEMHDCTYDYKTEGRQLLEQNNPVVSAPKLPKI